MRTTDTDRGQRTLAGSTTAAGVTNVLGVLGQTRIGTGQYQYRVLGAKFIQAAQAVMTGSGTGFIIVQYVQPDIVNVFTYSPSSVAADLIHSVTITAVPR